MRLVVAHLSLPALLVNGVFFLVLVSGLGCTPAGITTGRLTEAPSDLSVSVVTPGSSPVSSAPSPTPATTAAATATPASNATAPAGYSITVIYNTNPIQYLTVSDLAKLPQVQQNVEGTVEQGPTLLSALASIGIPNVSSVTIDGYTKGRLATAELTLTRDQITDNVILALVTRGTVKLTGTDIGAAKAIIDVNQITVK